MLKTKTQKTVTSLVFCAVCLLTPAASFAATSGSLTGSIAGTVRDNAGRPQLGAAVLLLSHQERVIQRVLTDQHGEFRLLGLLPNLYSVKVSLASFVPALKKDILVQPGMRSMLAVNLNTLFSSIQLSYPALDNGSVMSDDWKWVLRSAASTRPVMRLVDPSGTDAEGDAIAGMPPAVSGETRTAVFSGTHAVLRVSAGDSALNDITFNQAAMGTAFALSTLVGSNSSLKFSGNVAYGPQTGAPSAAFSTSYSRDVAGGSPEVSLTMRQLYMPGHFAAAIAGQDASIPALRTMSLAFDDHARIGDNLTAQYGFALDMVSFVDHLNYLSPYARLDYEISPGSDLEFAYTAGNARPGLTGPDEQPDEDLQRGLDTLALYPRLSMLNGQSEVQRGQEYEVAYSRKMGTRTYRVSAYSETVSNLALTMVAPAGMFSAADVLPDIFSGNSIFNAGTFASAGYSGAVTQNLGDNVSATVIYTSTGALTTDGHELVSDSPDDLRSMIRAGRRQAATTRINVTSPWTGTHLVAAYQFALGANQRWIEPGNLYSTSSLHTLPGLNIYVRQPIPGFGGRIVATADLRNLLAQGYLGLNAAQNQRILLVENPRSIRGGVSFIF